LLGSDEAKAPPKAVSKATVNPTFGLDSDDSEDDMSSVLIAKQVPASGGSRFAKSSSEEPIDVLKSHRYSIIAQQLTFRFTNSSSGSSLRSHALSHTEETKPQPARPITATTGTRFNQGSSGIDKAATLARAKQMLDELSSSDSELGESPVQSRSLQRTSNSSNVEMEFRDK
jgi:hypothetical protein